MRMIWSNTIDKSANAESSNLSRTSGCDWVNALLYWILMTCSLLKNGDAIFHTKIPGTAVYMNLFGGLFFVIE